MEKDAADATQKTIRILFNTSDLKEAQIAFSERWLLYVVEKYDLT